MRKKVAVTTPGRVLAVLFGVWALACALPGWELWRAPLRVFEGTPERAANVWDVYRGCSYRIAQHSLGLGDWVVISVLHNGHIESLWSVNEVQDVHVEDVRLTPRRDGVSIHVALSPPLSRFVTAAEIDRILKRCEPPLIPWWERDAGWSALELVDSVLLTGIAVLVLVTSRRPVKSIQSSRSIEPIMSMNSAAGEFDRLMRPSRGGSR